MKSLTFKLYEELLFPTSKLKGKSIKHKTKLVEIYLPNVP